MGTSFMNKDEFLENYKNIVLDKYSYSENIYRLMMNFIFIERENTYYLDYLIFKLFHYKLYTYGDHIDIELVDDDKVVFDVSYADFKFVESVQLAYSIRMIDSIKKLQVQYFGKSNS